jgi:hypothetical protein
MAERLKECCAIPLQQAPSSQENPSSFFVVANRMMIESITNMSGLQWLLEAMRGRRRKRPWSGPHADDRRKSPRSRYNRDAYLGAIKNIVPGALQYMSKSEHLKLADAITAEIADGTLGRATAPAAPAQFRL